MSNHASATANHMPFAAIYANSSARLAATGFIRQAGGGIVAFDSSDVGKFALQQSDNTCWMLSDDSPVTWQQFGQQGPAGPGGLRTLAATSLTIFVNASTGSDSNNGLTSGTALATIQAAINLIKQSYDLGGPRAAPVIIQLADGTYSGGANPVAMVSGPFVGQQQSTYTFPSTNEVPISIRGNASTPANVVLTSTGGSGLGTILSVWGASLGIEGCKVTNTGPGACLEAGGQANIQFGNLILGTCGRAKIQSEHNSLIENYSNFTVEGDSPQVIASIYHGSVWLTGTMTIGGNFTVTQFALARESSEISMVAASISTGGNTVTGLRFAIVSSSSINGVGSNLNFFPGTIAGTVDDGAYDGVRSIVGTVAWPTYIPTAAADNGPITTLGVVTGAYWIDGKTTHARVKIPITTDGTSGATYVKVSLPVLAKSDYFTGIARRVDGNAPLGGHWLGVTMISSDPANLYIATLTNTYPGANGAIITASVTYEAA